MLCSSLDLSSEVFARLGQVSSGALSLYPSAIKIPAGKVKDPAAADVAEHRVLSAHSGAGAAGNAASAPSLPFSAAEPQAAHL